MPLHSKQEAFCAGSGVIICIRMARTDPGVARARIGSHALTRIRAFVDSTCKWEMRHKTRNENGTHDGCMSVLRASHSLIRKLSIQRLVRIVLASRRRLGNACVPGHAITTAYWWIVCWVVKFSSRYRYCRRKRANYASRLKVVRIVVMAPGSIRRTGTREASRTR